MKKSLTAGGIVVSRTGDILVVNQNGNSWSLPKGHIDPGETAQEAAAREIREESGVSELKLIKEIGTYERYRLGLGGGDSKSELKQITLFLYTTGQMKLQPQDPANPEARWVRPEKVASFLTHPKDRDFFNDHLAEVQNFIESQK